MADRPNDQLHPFEPEFGSFNETVYTTRFCTEFGPFNGDNYPMPPGAQPDPPDFARSHNAPAPIHRNSDPHAGKGGM